MDSLKKDNIILSLLKSKDENDHNLVCKMFSLEDIMKIVDDYLTIIDQKKLDYYENLIFGILVSSTTWNVLENSNNKYSVYLYKKHYDDNYDVKKIIDFIKKVAISKHNTINYE